MDGLVVGPTNLGSFLMRGEPLARWSGFGTLDVNDEEACSSRCDVAVAIKTDVPAEVREHAERLVCEPLDQWWDSGPEDDPWEWIVDHHERNRYDDLIVNTPAMAGHIGEALPASVAVHTIPHHADPRVGKDWHDPEGPIVYAGQPCFVESSWETLCEAAAKIDREIVSDTSWEVLEGAALVLSLRLRPYDTRLNRLAKPQVKLANAAQAGIPVLSTDDPATLELWPEVVHAAIEDFTDAETTARLMQQALESAPPQKQFPQSQWLWTMAELLGMKKCVMIGAGRERRAGWFTLDADAANDPDVVATVPPVPEFVREADEIEMIHVLEHFHVWEVPPLLSELREALTDGGKLVLELPNLDVVIKVLSGELDRPREQWGMWPLYGDPSHADPLMCHKWCWTPESLTAELMRAGFTHVERREPLYHVPERDFRLEAYR